MATAFTAEQEQAGKPAGGAGGRGLADAGHVDGRGRGGGGAS